MHSKRQPRSEKSTQKVTPARAIYNLLIVDESGSMASIADQTVTGYQEILQTIGQAETKHPETRQYVSLVSFSTERIRRHFDLTPVKDILQSGPIDYEPDGGTPLWDCVGGAVTRLRHQLDLQGSEAQSTAVFVSILTDGYENSSVTYSQIDISDLIKTLQQVGWSFTYIGTDHDVHRVTDAIHIPKGNRVAFDRSDFKAGGLKKIKRSIEQLNEIASVDAFWEAGAKSQSNLMEE